MDNEFFENYEADLLFFDALLEHIDSRLDVLESNVAYLRKIVLSRYSVFILNPDEPDIN